MKKPVTPSPASDVFPTSGGSWLFDPDTGVLSRNPNDASAPRPADPEADQPQATDEVPQ